jgi:hypothetical protein
LGAIHRPNRCVRVGTTVGTTAALVPA